MRMAGVIYLDIDGVLCVRSRDGLSITRGNFQVPHPDCVKHLNYITDSVEANIVISSSWRKVYRISYIKDWFKAYGIKGNIIGTTVKEDVKGVSRAQQILADYKEKSGWGRALIIDDERNAFDDQWNDDFFFLHTDFNVGITLNHARQGIRFLLGNHRFKNFIKEGGFIDRGIV